MIKRAMSKETVMAYQKSICLGCVLAFEAYPGKLGCDAANYPSRVRRRCKFRGQNYLGNDIRKEVKT